MGKQSKGIKLFKDFFKKIPKTAKFAIISHRDADGFSAAFITLNALRKLGYNVNINNCFHYDYGDDGLAVIKKKLKTIKPDAIISLDLALDQNAKIAKEISTIAPLLIIDHHKLYNDLNSERITLIKAQMVSKKEPSRNTAAILSYTLFSSIANIKDFAWVAAIGITADRAAEGWKRFIANATKRAKLNLKIIKEFAELINAYSVVKKERFNYLFKLFLSKKPKEIIKDSELIKANEILNKELARILVDYEKNKEEINEVEVVFYMFDSRYRLKSNLIDILTERYPHKTIVIFQRKDSKVLFSARRADFKVRCNDMLEYAVRGVGVAGGHIPAAAGSADAKYIKKIKMRIVEYLLKNSHNNVNK